MTVKFQSDDFPESTRTIRLGGTITPPSDKTVASLKRLETYRYVVPNKRYGAKVKIAPGVYYRFPLPYERSSVTTSYRAGVTRSRVHGPATSGDIIYIRSKYPSIGVNRTFSLGDIVLNDAFLPLNENQRNQLFAECMDDLRDGKVHISNGLAESKQTIQMLALRTKPFFQSVIAAKRGHWNRIPKIMGFDRDGRASLKKKLKSPKGWSDLYLEYKFGWDPFFSDVHGLYELTREGLERNVHLVSGRRSLRFSEQDSGEDSKFRWQVSGKISYNCVITSRVDSFTLRSAAQLGLQNPLEPLWELTPWSFVVDWMFPVGNLLSAASARCGSDFFSGCFSRRMTYQKMLSIKASPDEEELSTAGRDTKSESFFRQGIGDYPAPLPYIKSPFSTSHVVTASALATQAYSRR